MRFLRAVALSLLTLALLGCAADDPLEFDVVAAPVDDAPTGDAAVEADVEPDCLGNPAQDPAVFPPAPEDEINRPSDDRIEDLRGQAQVIVPIRDNVFDVRFFRVDPCTQIIFENRGANPHNVIASAEGAFPTIEQEPLLETPQAIVLTAPGNYPFYCSIHGTTRNGQTGYVIVGDG